MASVWCRVVLAALTLLSAACAPTPPPSLTWSDCGDGFQCTRLQVPLDHANPASNRISISVIRLPATGDRIGSLLVNPGGPGVSGIDYTRAAPAIFPQSVRSRFDIVGFDPRGVGQSTPITCLPDAELAAFIAMDPTPDTPAERTALEKASKAFARACQSRSGTLLPHVSTTDAARDMDLLRAALGEEKLTYLGKSYGTYLGAAYAHLFPARVRAMVLDGGIDPTLSRERLNLDQAIAFETAYAEYARTCPRSTTCPFTTEESAQSTLHTLLKSTDKAPLSSEQTRPVPESLTTLGLLAPLYDRTTWPILSESLTQAQSGDGTLLLTSADSLVGRNEDGTYTNQTESGLAITCADTPHPTAGELTRAASESTRSAPNFGPYIMWSTLPCAYWPTRPTPPTTPKAPGTPPLLTIGTTRDPATPYHWSQSLTDHLQSATLLTYEGDGHTAYSNGSTCIDNHVNRYLTTLTTPPRGTRC
ncbi:alpha/beta hydrolase [Nonomuraea typhae]|uniref:Alpha/beta hydrolase n=1 Tax=Nonomuraea typhae TaxID=2603600 RepID=A0ABW7YVB0_9ACTN